MQPATVSNSRCGSHHSRGSVGTLSSGDVVAPPAALRKRGNGGPAPPAKSQSVAQIFVTKATPAHALSKEHRHKHRLQQKQQQQQQKQLVPEPAGAGQLGEKTENIKLPEAKPDA